MNNQTLAIYDNDLIWAIADTICSYLPNCDRESFAKQFQRTKATGRGVKATLIWAEIASWFLTDPTYGVVHYYPEASKEIEKVSSLFEKFQNGEDISESHWELAAEAARNAAGVYSNDRTKIKEVKAPLKIKSAMCACIAAFSMMPSKQQESLRSFGEAVTDQYTALTAAFDAAFEAGGEERSGQAAIACSDKFLYLIWQIVYSTC
ncbi:hypothetical protein [Aliterella atlantica]|uniref:Uncharacterized protein n=1 Tax=Aliterella atlantica CENA595 TaxID=1618023 RepID=A0A0D8ZS64_9CYAN|nr:hypothetical protein [Aliterella atlantica]KJH70056.1 hypothetical protein UH38_20085 [Aliterella atlantica CENA595]